LLEHSSDRCPPHAISCAFLGQDWFFYRICVLGAEAMVQAPGASIVYAGLLRVFPTLIVGGWLTMAGGQPEPGCVGDGFLAE
jgi:hypothetical protein